MFTKYELQVLRECLGESWDRWQDKVDRGIDVSERFMETFQILEDKIDYMIMENACIPTHKHLTTNEFNDGCFSKI